MSKHLFFAQLCDSNFEGSLWVVVEVTNFLKFFDICKIIVIFDKFCTKKSAEALLSITFFKRLFAQIYTFFQRLFALRYTFSNDNHSPLLIFIQPSPFSPLLSLFCLYKFFSSPTSPILIFYTTISSLPFPLFLFHSPLPSPLFPIFYPLSLLFSPFPL